MDGSLLDDNYARVLREWSARSKALGIQLLNAESRVLNIAPPSVDSEVDDDDDSDSDSEYESDSDDSSSTSESDWSDYDESEDSDG